MVKILNFKIIIEQDEDGYFIASVPAVPGCYSQGNTYEAAVKNIKEALELSLEVAKDKPSYSQRITLPTSERQENFIGVINLPVRIVY